jgi:hypothetical protein
MERYYTDPAGPGAPRHRGPLHHDGNPRRPGHPRGPQDRRLCASGCHPSGQRDPPSSKLPDISELLPDLSGHRSGRCPHSGAAHGPLRHGRHSHRRIHGASWSSTMQGHHRRRSLCSRRMRLRLGSRRQPPGHQQPARPGGLRPAGGPAHRPTTSNRPTSSRCRQRCRRLCASAWIAASPTARPAPTAVTSPMRCRP